MDQDVVVEFHLTVQQRIQLAIDRLPALTKDEIPLDDSCPICINPFDAILDGKAREGLGEEAPQDVDDELAGVTKLVGCGHVFCKACLVEWIRGRHGTCPSCRNVFSSIRPASDSDNESSDGDYVPGDDEEDDEDDGFFDSDDAFMDTESAFDDMDAEDDVDLDEDIDVDIDIDLDGWEADVTNAVMDNWGLSDGDGSASESVSEVEGLAMSAELPAANDGPEVYSDSGEGSGALQAPAVDAPQPKP